MSKKGVKQVAEIFSMMQNVRIDLMRLYERDPASPEYHQDLRLAAMLDDMKDYAKERFSKITME